MKFSKTDFLPFLMAPIVSAKVYPYNVADNFDCTIHPGSMVSHCYSYNMVKDFCISIKKELCSKSDLCDNPINNFGTLAYKYHHWTPVSDFPSYWINSGNCLDHHDNINNDYVPCDKPGKNPAPDALLQCKVIAAKTDIFCCEDDETKAPTTVFEGENYSIGAPEIFFRDADGKYKLDFWYTVGASAENLIFSLFKTGCEDTSDVSNILTTTAETVENSLYFKELSVDKTKIENNPLVVSEGGLKGFSAGSINFCVVAETFAGPTSVSFLKTEVSLEYDLTDNSFTIENNSLQADTVGSETSVIDVNYDVDACRCSSDAFTCIPSDTPLPVLTQNELVFICLSPNDESKEDVDISNFKMDFVQKGHVVYKAADIGSNEPIEGSLSHFSYSEQTYKVTSRVVTELFEGGSSFDITGVVYLEFKSRRLFALVEKQGLRGIRGLNTFETETPFSLNLKIEKTKEGAGNEMPRGNLSVIPTAVVAATVLALVFVIRKKLA